MQTKKQSFIEASTNTAVGFVISYASTFIIFPLMGFNSSAGKNIIITLFFTVVSIFRGYVIRRLFNKEKPLTLCELKGCNMYPVYDLNNGTGHRTSSWGLNRCSRCGKEDYWQFDH